MEWFSFKKLIQLIDDKVSFTEIIDYILTCEHIPLIIHPHDHTPVLFINYFKDDDSIPDMVALSIGNVPLNGKEAIALCQLDPLQKQYLEKQFSLPFKYL